MYQAANMSAPTPNDNTPSSSAASQRTAALRIDPAMKTVQTASTAKRRWQWLAAVVVFLLVATALVLKPSVIAVSTATVSKLSPTVELVTLTSSGYLVAQRRASLASKASGRLVYLAVREGSRVKEGDLLARLDARDVAAQFAAATSQIEVAKGVLAQAQAELTDARAAAHRARDLVAKNFASPATLDTAVARENRAIAALESAKAALAASQHSANASKAARDETEIRAPFDGVVVAKNANVGDVITPFSNAAESKGAVLTLADLSTLEAEVDVSESNISKVSVGQACEIQLDAFPDERFTGQVVSIVPTVDRAKATIMVKVRFDEINARFLPDMSTKVSFLSRPASEEEKKPRLMAPKTAIRQGVAFTIENDKAKAVSVKTGKQAGGLVEILEGLQVGDTVINPVDEHLKDGSPVEKQTRR
jgi:RND family efflux transporter MFP subunit